MILELGSDTGKAFQWMPKGSELRAKKGCVWCQGKGLVGVRLKVQGGGSVTVREPVPCKCAVAFIPADTEEERAKLAIELDDHYTENAKGRLCQCIWCQQRVRIIEDRKKRGVHAKLDD